MQYSMMRLFLANRKQPDLFRDRDVRSAPLSRADFLRAVFAAEVRFVHANRIHVYTPYPSSDPNILAGIVARERTVTIGKPPEEGYKKEIVPDWDTANVFIDVSGDLDGQKVAMQESDVAARPIAVFRSLTDYLNETYVTSDWLISVNTITSEQGFWDAVAKYRGNITEIDLVFAAPNIWGGKTETENALKQLSGEGAKEVEVKLRNLDGKMDPGTKENPGSIGEGVEYIRKGGGRLKIKSKNRTIYNSEDHAVRRTPKEDSSIPTTEIDVAMALAKWLLNR